MLSKILQQGRTCVLTINDCALEDDGEYTAVIGEEKVSAKLFVQDFVEILSPLRDQRLLEKDTLRLSIEVSDKEAPGVWMKNGEPIPVTDPSVIIEVRIK